MYGQGRVFFNNLVSGNAITIASSGAYVGANYSAQLLWAAGTFADLSSFLAANPSSSTPVAFFGATGGSPGTDGAGLFDGGTVAMNGVAGTYTMLVRAWTGANYATAVSGGSNAGQSSLFQVAVTASPTPAVNTTFGSFTVSAAPVPEPTVLALAGVGSAALLMFRRRNA